jgi:hypothetical protein
MITGFEPNKASGNVNTPKTVAESSSGVKTNFWIGDGDAVMVDNSL